MGKHIAIRNAANSLFYVEIVEREGDVLIINIS